MKAGTTKEQWDQYYIDLKAHELFCQHAKILFYRVNWLVKDGVDKGTASWILETLNHELSRMQHMDAPNEPGYYRANND
jgi:hypothetical protein